MIIGKFYYSIFTSFNCVLHMQIFQSHFISKLSHLLTSSSSSLVYFYHFPFNFQQLNKSFFLSFPIHYNIRAQPHFCMKGSVHDGANKNELHFQSDLYATADSSTTHTHTKKSKNFPLN